jgi:murein L,D-transpeptidase YcbB/YkuD
VVVRVLAFALAVALGCPQPGQAQPRAVDREGGADPLARSPPGGAPGAPAPGVAPAPGEASFLRGGFPTAQARALAAALAAAADVGLDPADYAGAAWAERIRALDAGRAAPGEAARFEADLRAAAVRHARDLRHGRASPRALGHALPREPFDADAFVAALARADDARALLARLEPRLEPYRRLVRALPRLRALAERRRGEPPLAAPARAVRPGEPCPEAPRVADLLAALGDLAEQDRAAASAAVHGPELARAVARFQARHGLRPDGVLGARTVAALNVPLDRRVRQVELALERWRWLPRALGDRWIVVNVPAHHLEAGEGDPPRAALALDVIVGARQDGRRTPLLVARAKAIVFSPYWDVPAELAVEELVPRLEADPGLAEGDGYFVETREARLPVGPGSLALVREGAARIRQRPGPRNTLGPLKVVMPNPHDVYLHGTASPRVFERRGRALSHGCIRVDDPGALAAFLLDGEPGWDAARLEAAMARAEPLPVTLGRPATVLIAYATATADDDGALRFWPDLYGEDARLERALRRARPPSRPAPRPLPGADAPGVDVDEVGRRVVPDAAAPEREGQVPEPPGRHAGEPEVERAPVEVEAPPRHPGAALAQHRVGARRPVAAHDLEDRARAPGGGGEAPGGVEHAGVDGVDLAGPVVAQEPAHLRERVGEERAVEVDGVERLAGVGVEHPQPARSARGGEGGAGAERGGEERERPRPEEGAAAEERVRGTRAHEPDTFDRRAAARQSAEGARLAAWHPPGRSRTSPGAPSSPTR